MPLEFLLLSLGFNSFLLFRDEQNSKCGRVLAVIKCIYLPSTYVIPRSEKEGTKPPYVCPGCSNHTHGNN
jgi:hypothetical protein